jgi:2,3-bisphosphoglycerate-dependent phosphoglycerate mutase
MKTRLIPLIAATVLMAFAAVANAQQAVILVRHAELQGAAMAEPKQLPLSEAGAARAQRLASMLKDAGVGAIYVTDFVRTQKTAEPLARAINKELTVLPKGDPGELVERLRKNHDGQTVLLVGHTDTLPGLLKALGHPVEIKIEPEDFANMFVVVPKREGAPAFLHLRY